MSKSLNTLYLELHTLICHICTKKIHSTYTTSQQSTPFYCIRCMHVTFVIIWMQVLVHSKIISQKWCLWFWYGLVGVGDWTFSSKYNKQKSTWTKSLWMGKKFSGGGCHWWFNTIMTFLSKLYSVIMLLKVHSILNILAWSINGYLDLSQNLLSKAFSQCSPIAGSQFSTIR